jgi:hypothetical protein
MGLNDGWVGSEIKDSSNPIHYVHQGPRLRKSNFKNNLVLRAKPGNFNDANLIANGNGSPIFATPYKFNTWN